MSAYVRYYRRLQALTQRLSTYLDRLEARAREFGVSSARTAMEMQITDPASVSAFRSEVEAGLRQALRPLPGHRRRPVH